MRQPADVPQSEKDTTVMEVIRLLEMEEIADAVIGTLETTLFSFFDALLFLRWGGQVVYFGEVGVNSKTLLEYFETNGGPRVQQNENPAECILDVPNGLRGPESERDWAEVWQKSDESAATDRQVERLLAEGQQNDITAPELPRHSENKLGPVSQYWAVLKRLWVTFYRLPDYVPGRFGHLIILDLIVGISYLQVLNNQIGLQMRLFIIFFTLGQGITTVNIVQPHFSFEQSWALREMNSGFCSWIVWAEAIVDAEIPVVIISATVFALILTY
ncbi:hypothetical protein HDU93_002734 [Gonapodya sp. JEL0774]|nr:hypothetical protein HDU93_002734 [Gonapodya sp. JEL0774]